MNKHTPIASLIINPTEILVGQSATLSWSTQFATIVLLNGETVNQSGSIELNNTAGKYTYKLEAVNKWGHITLEATLSVVGQPPVVDFKVIPDVILEGQSATLFWDTTDADEVSLDGELVSVDGSKIVTGGVGQHIFTLTATNFAGTITQDVILTIEDVKPAISLEIIPNTINERQSATLSWSVQNADTITLNGQTVAAEGSMSVSPDVGISTYSIEARGFGDVVTKDVSLTVLNIVPDATFDITPSSIIEGEIAQAIWTTMNADSVKLNGVFEPLSGRQNLAPSAGIHTYELTVEGFGDVITKTVSLTVLEKPVSQPTLLGPENLEFEGAFRFPVSGNYSYGGTATSYNPTNKSMFVVGHDWYQQIGEVTIPSVLSTGDLTTLPRAKNIQSLISTTSRVPVYSLEGTVKVGGTLVIDDMLVVSLYEYYDADADAKRSHYTVKPKNDLIGGDVQGLYELQFRSGFVGGYMAHVPVEWQDRLGCKYLAGNCGLAITSRTSRGPAAFGFDPATFNVASGYIAPVVPLLYYPYYKGSSAPYVPGDYPLDAAGYDVWNSTSHVGGCVFPPNTDSVLFFGQMGTGPNCYGAGTSDPSLDGVAVSGTNGQVHYCYDPCDSSKGYHSYPYVFKIWAYDANDLLKVKNGLVKPYELRPYKHWSFVLPRWNVCKKSIYGACYDVDQDRILFTVANAAAWGESIICSFKIKRN